MADRAAELLAGVLAEPDSDAARQVYADELLGRSDPRGELIQLDLALAGALSIRKREALRAHRAALVERHRTAWWPTPLVHRVHRGFIEAVSGTAGELLAAAPAVFGAEPVVEVTVTEPGTLDDVRALAAARWLARVRRLIVRGLDDDGFTALVPACRRLAALNADAGALTARALALGDHLPACRMLALTGNPIGDDGLANLAAWHHAAEVEALYLAECELSTDGVAALVARPLPALAKLVLTGNAIDDAVAGVLAARAAHLPALRQLELKATRITRAALLVFEHSGLALTRLDLRRTQVRRDDATALPYVRTGTR